MEIATHTQILYWAEELDHVITIKDLQLIARTKSNNSVFRLVRSLVEAGVLLKIKRGVYATDKATLATIAHRMYPQSYISTGTVLSKKAIIGSIPSKRIQAVRIGAPRKFSCKLGVIEYLSIAPKLYFGYEVINHQLWALPEKAFLDVCYYYYKGKHFSFNPESDIHRDLLDEGIIAKYLKRYDKRFLTFFKEKFSS